MRRTSQPRKKRAKKPVTRPRHKTPEWKCTDLGANKLGIACPGCGEKTVVNKSRWITVDKDFTTRGCTYCGWFARIPLDVLPARDPRRDDYV